MRYSAVSVRFCCWFTAQCNTVQCGKEKKKQKKKITFLLSIKYLLHVSSCLLFSQFRDLCCTCSTVSNYNSDMQVHVTQSEEKLISVPVVSGKSRKTNKSTWEVIAVVFFSHSLDSSSSRVSQKGMLKINNTKLMTVVLCFLVVLNAVGVRHRLF